MNDLGGYALEAGSYARSRPGYPGEAMDYLAEHLALGAEATVLDLGAGTGKLTESLLFTGAQFAAVEPLEAMQAEFVRLLPNIPISAGTAESIPFPDAFFDVVVVGTAFHWFDYRRCLPELARVLRPGGSLGLVWNVLGHAEWVQELKSLRGRFGRPISAADKGAWRQALECSSLFSITDSAAFPFTVPSSRDHVLSTVFSWNELGALPAESRSQVIDEVDRILLSHPPAFPFPYTCLVYVASGVCRACRP